MSETISITYDKAQVQATRLGISLVDLLAELPPRQPQPVAAVVNGVIQELDYRLYTDSTIKWLDYNSSSGHRIYRRSVILMMLAAVAELFAERKLWVSHSLDNGLFCRLEYEEPLSAADIARLEQRMHELAAADLPIKRSQVSREDGANFFLAQNKVEKAQLILGRQSNTLNLYSFETAKTSITEYFFGRLTNRSGLLTEFSLQPFDDGFVLRLPARSFTGQSNADFCQPRRIQAARNQHRDWVNLLGLSTAGDLNKVIDQGDFSELVLIAETLQEHMLYQISTDLVKQYPDVRLVLIAGPSSAGKTTFTERLGIQLRTLGIRPLTISMDNYFVDRAKTPLDEFGKPDFEGVAALDLELFNRQLADLIAGKEVNLPRYDFTKGQRDPKTTPCRLAERQVVIVEGIHALNESLTSSVPQHNKRKIFVSCLTQLNLDAYSPIATSDNRLVRRIIRDMKFRNMSPAWTIDHWESVRRGEHHNIYPYQEAADYFFNSALIYELPVLRPYIEQELAAITPDLPAYVEARRLLRFIQYFTPTTCDIIPKNSILQEFLGGSCFDV